MRLRSQSLPYRKPDTDIVKWEYEDRSIRLINKKKETSMKATLTLRSKWCYMLSASSKQQWWEWLSTPAKSHMVMESKQPGDMTTLSMNSFVLVHKSAIVLTTLLEPKTTCTTTRHAMSLHQFITKTYSDKYHIKIVNWRIKTYKNISTEVSQTRKAIRLILSPRTTKRWATIQARRHPFH